MHCKSSRSYITDLVTPNIEGSRHFPLYPLSGEKVKFEYGVFLLNKNIQQLMNVLGIPVRNMKCTLANLEAILFHLQVILDKINNQDVQLMSSPSVDWHHVFSIEPKSTAFSVE